MVDLEGSGSLPITQPNTRKKAPDKEEDSVEKIAADIVAVFKQNPDLAGMDDPEIQARLIRLAKRKRAELKKSQTF